MEKFYDLKSIANPEKEFRIVSLAQFRPEKDHLKQLAALKVLQKQLAPEEFQRVKLVLVGSCRNQEDQERYLFLIWNMMNRELFTGYSGNGLVMHVA